MAVVASAISLVLAFIIKEDLKRLRYKKTQGGKEQVSKDDEEKVNSNPC